jgi:hypothetical protein
MSQDKQSAIEAAARAVRTAWRSGANPTDADLARAAIHAYLSALGQDEGAVEASMKSVLKSWKQAGVKCSPDLEASELAARAVLRTLATRAQGESS